MFTKSTVEGRAYRSVEHYLHRYKTLAITIFLLGVLSSLSEGIGIGLFIPFFQTVMAEDDPTVGTDGRFSSLYRWLADYAPWQRTGIISFAIVIAIALTSMLAYVYRVAGHWLEAEIGHQMRRDMAERYLHVEFPNFKQSRTGDLLSVLATETWRASRVANLFLEQLVTYATLGIYGILMMLISWKMTLLIGAAMGLVSLSVQPLSRRADDGGRVAARANSRLSQRMIELLGGMEVIRAFGREDFEQRRFELESRKVGDSMFRLSILSAAIEPLYELLAAVLMLVVAFLCIRDPSNLPPLLVFLFILYRMQPRIKRIEYGRTQLASLAGAAEQVNTTLGHTTLSVGESQTAGQEGHVPETFKEAIVFDDVRFVYPEASQPALDRTNFEIRAGGTTAIVGPSGSGKSTAVKLLLGFYQPESGEIRVDGRPLSSIDLRHWRRQVSLVSQDLFMFNGSVRENIRYGDLAATDEQIEDAAKLAYADEFIEQLPKGYDTVVGDRGARLSGGQLQRLSLARAFVRRPQLLILDEATNALDSRSEELVARALDQFGSGCTKLVIAHRLATITNADRIVVLDSGSVSQQGTAAELIDKPGLFSDLYRLQQRDSITQ